MDAVHNFQRRILNNAHTHLHLLPFDAKKNFHSIALRFRAILLTMLELVKYCVNVPIIASLVMLSARKFDD